MTEVEEQENMDNAVHHRITWREYFERDYELRKKRDLNGN